MGVNNNEERKEIYFTVRGFLVNSPIIMKVDILPVETCDYKNCVQEMELFAINLIKYADISLAVRLAREILKRLPSMFPPDIDNLINQWEKNENNGNNGRGV